jgi:IclR family acetate operon transcriptional repressor
MTGTARPGPRPASRIQSLERMDAILDVIAEAPERGVRLTDIAARTGLHKNTAFSLLKTMVALGYCDHLRDGQTYRIGRRTFEFARKAERNLDIVTLIRPLMLRLVWQVRESLSLAVPAQESCLVVSTVEGTYGVRGSRFQGQHAPYHASALGKAILAFQTDEDRSTIIGHLRLERFTSRTLGTAAELEAECRRVRERGHALSLAEEEIGASAVAAPVMSRGGSVLGALAIWGPSARLTRQRLADLGPRLTAECGAVLGP